MHERPLTVSTLSTSVCEHPTLLDVPVPDPTVALRGALDIGSKGSNLCFSYSSFGHSGLTTLVSRPVPQFFNPSTVSIYKPENPTTLDRLCN